MAYNNGFPIGYPQFPAWQPPAQRQNGITWVQGEAGAKSYMVPPNSNMALFDSENQCIYLKSVDATGMPSMKVLDYTIRNDAGSPSEAKDVYATREEVEALRGQIESLKMRIGKAVKKSESSVSNDE